jgi:hypothetical protein
LLLTRVSTERARLQKNERPEHATGDRREKTFCMLGARLGNSVSKSNMHRWRWGARATENGRYQTRPKCPLRPLLLRVEKGAPTRTLCCFLLARTNGSQRSLPLDLEPPPCSSTPCRPELGSPAAALELGAPPRSRLGTRPGQLCSPLPEAWLRPWTLSSFCAGS